MLSGINSMSGQFLYWKCVLFTSLCIFIPLKWLVLILTRLFARVLIANLITRIFYTKVFNSIGVEIKFISMFVFTSVVIYFKIASIEYKINLYFPVGNVQAISHQVIQLTPMSYHFLKYLFRLQSTGISPENRFWGIAFKN